jgi:hypothetical protein
LVVGSGSRKTSDLTFDATELQFYGEGEFMGKLLKQAKRKMKKFAPKLEKSLLMNRRKAKRPRHDKASAAVVAVEQNRAQTERAVRPAFVLNPQDTKPPNSDFSWATPKRRKR